MSQAQSRIKLIAFFLFFFFFSPRLGILVHTSLTGQHIYVLIRTKNRKKNVQIYTPSRYIDKDSFECPEPRLVQQCHIPLGEHQSPAGKFFRRQKIDYSLFLSNLCFGRMLVEFFTRIIGYQSTMNSTYLLLILKPS